MLALRGKRDRRNTLLDRYGQQFGYVMERHRVEAALMVAFAQALTKLVPYSWWSQLLGPIGSGEQQLTAIQNDEAARSVAGVANPMASLPAEAGVPGDAYARSSGMSTRLRR